MYCFEFAMSWVYLACCDLGLSVAVLAQFDFSGSGHIELSELSKLGTAPQSTGQKLSIWTGDKTERVLKKMGKGSDGQVSCEEAAEYLEHALPVDEERFQSVIAEFAADAKAARKRQENRRMREQIRQKNVSSAVSPSSAVGTGDGQRGRSARRASHGDGSFLAKAEERLAEHTQVERQRKGKDNDEHGRGRSNTPEARQRQEKLTQGDALVMTVCMSL